MVQLSTKVDTQYQELTGKVNKLISIIDQQSNLVYNLQTELFFMIDQQSNVVDNLTTELCDTMASMLAQIKQSYSPQVITPSTSTSVKMRWGDLNK